MADPKPDKVKAVIDFSREYGLYRRSDGQTITEISSSICIGYFLVSSEGYEVPANYFERRLYLCQGNW
jgi:hypothetical protein